MIYVTFDNVKDEIDKFVDQDLGNNGNNNGNSNSKYPKFISFSINNRTGYSKELITTLKIIYIDFNKLKDKSDKFIDQNSGNYGNGNSNSNIKCFKFINFFVNIRSSYFKQLITTKVIIQVDINNIEVNNTVNILFEWKVEYNLRKKVREAKRK